eukprot:255836-Lingulodinium_polyedra.AAC.1
MVRCIARDKAWPWAASTVSTEIAAATEAVEERLDDIMHAWIDHQSKQLLESMRGEVAVEAPLMKLKHEVARWW